MRDNLLRLTDRVQIVVRKNSARGTYFWHAGPQQRVYFQPDEVNTAIVTCGGLCPGLNMFIRELVCGLYGMYGVTSVIGIEDVLEPYMRNVVELHWGKHQQDYVDGLKKQLAISLLYGNTLEDLIKEAYNNSNLLPESGDAAKVWILEPSLLGIDIA